jgi:glyoxylase-like metal-dependent hydrolase (beta-lactamase superfamily II)
MVKSVLNDFTENTYIVSEGNDCYIIDPGTNFEGIKQVIEENNLNVLAVLLTHGHFDHTGSLNQILEEYDVSVYLHELERDFMFDVNLNLSGITYHKFKIESKSRIITIKDGHEFPLGTFKIRTIHTPGHTRGCVSYLYKKYIFAGDTLFKGTVGRTDLPTSDAYELEQSLKRILEETKDNTVVYPGHGHFTTILNEKYDNPFLKNVIK